MPELPETEITMRSLEVLVGKRVKAFSCDLPKALRVAKSPIAINADIAGRNIVALHRHGKAIFVQLGAQYGEKGEKMRLLVFHQRMSGSCV